MEAALSTLVPEVAPSTLVPEAAPSTLHMEAAPFTLHMETAPSTLVPEAASSILHVEAAYTSLFMEVEEPSPAHDYVQILRSTAPQARGAKSFDIIWFIFRIINVYGIIMSRVCAKIDHIELKRRRRYVTEQYINENCKNVLKFLI
jgi:hypothetical protein